ncbi:Ribosomal large subunit pseudouridine synthase D (23S rRNA pseudouridine(1911/1915/1917) synthase) (rRNA pseudouridylate synthase D) (rRNA-uridine isomerase D) [Durusdinium trenchii]|uniref:Ribosomal large subunit pseudouridine synthase D (23S rRNA pseudouridine(1911/1915/1917) synthase) (rRNA pseudouridylate synthase D) (rRNA-uridine isomerase D) n=1 Tax=Durusdinium trenchii TaxID=1381693 RepID=A0ABP0QY10_9DINO
MSSAMSVGPWHLALQFLRRVGAQKETLSSFATNGFWRMAATFLSEAMHVGLRISALAHSLLVSACEKRGAWEWSLRFCSGRLGTLSGTYNSVMSASEKSTYWPVSLQLLGELRAKEVEPSSVNFCTAISATDRGERPDLGLAVLWESLWLPLDLKISMLPWSLARLGISDPAWLHLACVELLEKRGTLSTVSSKELSNVAWSLGMSAVLLPAVQGPLAREAVARLRRTGEDRPRLSLDDLVNTAWGFSSAPDPALYDALQAEMLRHVARRAHTAPTRDAPVSEWSDVVAAALGTTWACRFADMLRLPFLRALRATCARYGAHLDRRQPFLGYSRLPPTDGRAGVSVATDTPCVAERWSERMVLFKPSGWEVFGENFPNQLLTYVRRFADGPLARDPQHRFGFLHRLDVPTSGLILCASSYQAFFDLQLQLHAGEIERDYLLLCHGLCQRHHFDASLAWRGNEPTRAAGQGKPSKSWVKPMAQGFLKQEAMTMAAARIGTGRRHQLRSHFSFSGYPVVSDQFYTSEEVFQRPDLATNQANISKRWS